ncbi:ABC transporter permease [Conexibacter sp. JD483]|uniref:ABC transporter permease n=1 Tax=unclassified Conexibacter TaxID=2627773 RepID=UPI002728F844|nr:MULTISPECIES: ABC transporter permease [unclassified Conexibacter]MDO8186845.1 ABC transporter permease [Conexibacter sp. CPCC 205706]MDO8197401.1 ABC transporter permease [Conexibacter sp. CPCC 205762]MDR9372702.1 ABC transporter permease [Conexibacter sp. JD483]
MSARGDAARVPGRRGRRRGERDGGRRSGDQRSRLLPADALRLGAHGLTARRARALLSALGVAIGVAAMVAVLGVGESSRTRVLDELRALGTNLLTVGPGQSFFGDEVTLPATAAPSLRGLPTVLQAAGTTSIDQPVLLNDRIPAGETGGIQLLAAEANLLGVVGGSLRSGRFLDGALVRYPAVVLGAVTAKRLGIDRPGQSLFVGGRWMTIAGILRKVPLVPELDAAALIGYPVAHRLFGTTRSASKLYVRADPGAVVATRRLLAPAVDPEAPEEVAVSRPSDALAAQAATEDALTALLLGLGSVALLVGGIGIANVMVIAVLERRREIGLRRALGAARRHIAIQFLCEALLLSGLGGLMGVLLGAGGTAIYAATQDVRAVIPPLAVAGGLVAALLMGAVAGLYPALRATRLSPTEALRTG